MSNKQQLFSEHGVMNSNCSAGIFSMMHKRASWNKPTEQLLNITPCSLNNVDYFLKDQTYLSLVFFLKFFLIPNKFKAG